jgi:putative ABC transport system permease protein
MADLQPIIKMTLLKIIYRNFTHSIFTNLINLTGLAISLTLVILLSVYCYSELTTDKFHKNVNEIFLYRKSPDGVYISGILAETVKDKVPGLKTVVRTAPSWEAPVFQIGNQEPIVSDLLFADVDFFKIFSYEQLEGDLETALNEPLTIVLSSDLSRKLFGAESAIGKQIKYNNGKVLTVSGVFKEPEKNSCMNFSSITSMDTKKILQSQNGEFTEWDWSNFQIFLLLEKGYNPQAIADAILQLIPEKEKGNYSKASLFPFQEIHFSNFNFFGNNFKLESRKKVLVLLLVATLVLFIALINFINIFSSQLNERIKQTGIMKVLGAGRFIIIINIISESLIFFLAAFLIALQISSAISPIFQNYTGITFNDRIFGSPGFIIISLLVIFSLGILFSIIPALRISKSYVIDNLHKTIGKKKAYSGNRWLVTFQFTVSIALIAFTILIRKQVTYGTDSFGMNKGNILCINLTPQLRTGMDLLKQTLEKEAAIDEVSFTQYFPGKPISNWGVDLNLKGDKKSIFFDTFCADHDFFNMLGIELVSGKFYSENQSDKISLLVNESFIRQYDISDILGKEMFTLHGKKAEVVGIIRDFHYKPVNEQIAPLIIMDDKAFLWCMVHLKTENFEALDRTMKHVKKIVSEISPSFPVEISFLDSAIQNLYTAELRFRRTFLILAMAAIGICCMGILAMSMSECERRVKEFGIRRVNGAKVSEIMVMLNKRLVRWVIIAFLIATPFSWYLMTLWLRNYVYKTEISWWIFVFAGFAALIIAVLTVSWQTIRAATRNPVDSLRYE